jgi:hypothetical protein
MKIPKILALETVLLLRYLIYNECSTEEKNVGN